MNQYATVCDDMTMTYNPICTAPKITAIANLVTIPSGNSKTLVIPDTLILDDRDELWKIVRDGNQPVLTVAHGCTIVNQRWTLIKASAEVTDKEFLDAIKDIRTIFGHYWPEVILFD